MSSELAIQARGLSKRYLLGQHLGTQMDLRDAIGSLLRTPIRKARGNELVAPRGSIWALDDVSVDVARGEVLGVVGRNGAGKTTLLKILSRITDPTKGEARIWGRVGSLLEVGTGFHPDLTGRENVYLNGAILGMHRAEIARKFDEIVAFSEVERFIDTPVKRYSSGMQMRLAFAVAAHLEPEVLIVDEVLAVGDAAFQQKCLGKMGEVGSGGRTVILVSHNASAITSLATRCLWLEGGRVRDIGEPHAIIADYLGESIVSDEPGYADLSDPELRRGVPKETEKQLLLDSVRFLDASGATTGVFAEGDTMRIRVGVQAVAVATSIEFVLPIRTIEGVLVCTLLSGSRTVSLAPGAVETEVVVPRLPLRPGRYTIDLYMLTGIPQDMLRSVISFEVIGARDPHENPRYARDRLGVVTVEHQWGEIVQLGRSRRVTA